jgi:hypothetical protein
VNGPVNRRAGIERDRSTGEYETAEGDSGLEFEAATDNEHIGYWSPADALDTRGAGADRGVAVDDCDCGSAAGEAGEAVERSDDARLDERALRPVESCAGVNDPVELMGHEGGVRRFARRITIGRGRQTQRTSRYHVNGARSCERRDGEIDSGRQRRRCEQKSRTRAAGARFRLGSSAVYNKEVIAQSFDMHNGCVGTIDGHGDAVLAADRHGIDSS